MGVETAYVAVGANTGARRETIENAVARLGHVPGIEVVACSTLHETAPVDAPAGSPDFLNGVLELRTDLPPEALLAICQRLERDAGRERGVRNAPRPLDLDLLLFGERVIDSRELRVPHPRMWDRDFVMRPLAELLPDPASLRARFATPPVILRDAAAVAALTDRWRQGRCTIGLVPTMGALHAGHGSLLQMAREECDRVVATIFVNPLQFAPGEDLDAYPRTFDADCALLRQHRIDAVFAPPSASMYGPGFCSTIAVGAEAREMEGAMRPDHFAGVTTVVAKLFNAAQPHRAYFGQKDAQQVAVLKRLVADLSYPIEMRIGGIVRDPDGLALSSRNVYLEAGDREAALALIRGLRAARGAWRDGCRDASALLQTARAVFAAEPRVRLDYLELRQPDSLAPLPPGPVQDARMLVAAWLGAQEASAAGGRPVRLLDNLAMHEDE